MQLVNFRSRVVGNVPKLEVARSNLAPGGADRALKKIRPVYFRREGGFVDTPVYERSHLTAGDSFAGPAVVEEPDSTTIVPPSYRVSVDDFRQLVIERID